MEEIKRIIKTSEIIKLVSQERWEPTTALTMSHREDDSKWPQKNKDGRQELEIRLGNDHISFEVSCKCPSSNHILVPY